jgi:ribose 5-phosphate isomerase B
MIKKIIIGSDHAGFELKKNLIVKMSKDFLSLKATAFEIQDLGTDSEDSVDYPDFSKAVCAEVIKANDSKVLGLLICGSGQGMAMSANKHKNIRAALCWTENIARLSRQHNNANVLCLSSREVDQDLNYKILKAFLTTSFEGGRHQARIDKF